MSSAHTPNAFLGSVALHALLVALILAFAWLTKKTPEDTTPIFELVAGEGDNYAATEAPALGRPDLPVVKLPDIPDPPPSVSPIEAAPVEESPVEAASPVVEPEPVKPVPPPVKPVNMAKLVDRIADKRAANIEKQFKKDQKAAEARAAKEAAAQATKQPPQKKTMTKEEFDRLNKGKSSPSKKPPASTPITPKRIDTAGIAGGVKGGSTTNKTGGAGGTALTRAEIELSDAYISLLIQRLKEAHQKPAGLSDLLQATVSFRLTSSGTVTNVTIVSSSRNSEFDRSVLAAFRRISLPPPPANLKTNDYTITFKMKEDV